MDKLIAYLHKHPKVNIVIEGHTDDIGSEVANQLLSENRAKAVYIYVLDAFIEKSRVTYKGYGESKPLVANTTEDGRVQNRRTSFRIK